MEADESGAVGCAASWDHEVDGVEEVVADVGTDADDGSVEPTVGSEPDDGDEVAHDVLVTVGL